MTQPCHALLDACPGAHCLVSPQTGVLHANREFLEFFPTLHPAKDWPALLKVLGVGDPQAVQPGSRFTTGAGDRLFGIQVSAFSADGETLWLLSATAIAAQQKLKHDLQAVQQGVGSGHLDRGVTLPPGSSGMAQRVGAAVNGMLQSLRDQVGEIATAVGALADCDLRVHVDESGDGELGRLRTRLSVTVANLTESIRQTIASSESIAATTAEVARENQLLAERTREQADAVQNTSANMEELSAAVANAAANAESADRQGQQTTRLAEAGRAAVGEVVEAMASIHRSADEVGEIVGVINDIAFQTNILALNAAVEAARAGKHGRGFAIVAEEVRALAGRSATAAKQIRTLIERSGDIASDGRHLALQADARMQEILDGVHTTSQQVAAISLAAREQTAGIADANEALRRIDELTQQNNELVASLAASSQELDRQARYLTEACRNRTSATRCTARPRPPRSRRQRTSARSWNRPSPPAGSVWSSCLTIVTPRSRAPIRRNTVRPTTSWPTACSRPCRRRCWPGTRCSCMRSRPISTAMSRRTTTSSASR